MVPGESDRMMRALRIRRLLEVPGPLGERPFCELLARALAKLPGDQAEIQAAFLLGDLIYSDLLAPALERRLTEERA